MNLIKRILLNIMIFIFSLTCVCSASGKMLPILLYHNVTDFYSPENKGDNISPKNLEAHFEILKDFGFNTITLEDYYNYRVNGGELPENPLIISFDDGYISNYLIAYPLLKKYGHKATFFTVTKAAYDSDYCNYRHFSWKQAAEMQKSRYVDIQSHSYSHQIHSEGSQAEISNEITASYSDIFVNLGKTPIAYAYPSGKFTAETQAKAEETGYKMQIIVKGGINTDETPLNELMRLNVDGDMSASDLINLIIKYKQNVKEGA